MRGFGVIVLGLAGCGRIGFSAQVETDAPVLASCAFTRPVTVTAAADPLSGDYSVRVELDHASLVAAGKALASGDDLIVTHDGYPIDRVLAVGSAWNTLTTTLWFRLQAPIAAGASDGSYALCYGTPGGAPLANADKVFLFADDFSGGALDATKWTVHDLAGAATVGVTAGALAIDGTSPMATPYDTAGATTVAQFGTDIAVESSVEMLSQALSSQTEWKMIYGLMDGMNAGLVMVNSEGSLDHRVVYFQDPGYVDLGDSTLDALTFGWQRLLVTYRGSGRVDDFENGAMVAARMGVALASRKADFAYSPDVPSGGEAFSLRFDDIIIRRYVTSDALIVVSLGVEQ